jgi:hypothetical protein
MSMQTCPKCQRVSSAETVRCECGYDFLWNMPAPKDPEPSESPYVERHSDSTLVGLRLALICYLVSFFLPYDDSYGFGFFFIGMLYCWLLPLTFAWWANVAFVIGLLAGAKRSYASASIWGIIATFLAIGWLLIRGVHRESPLREAPAYWAWLGSMMILAITCLKAAVRSKRQTVRQSELLDEDATDLPNLKS